MSRHLLLVPAQVIHSVPMCLQSMGGSPPVNCEKAYSTPKIRIVFGDFILSVSSMFQGLCQQRDGHGDRGAGGGGERGHGDQRHPAPLPEVRPGYKHTNIPPCLCKTVPSQRTNRPSVLRRSDMRQGRLAAVMSVSV